MELEEVNLQEIDDLLIPGPQFIIVYSLVPIE